MDRQVEQLVPLGRSFAFQEIHLVIAVEMVLVLAFAELHAFEQLLGDVGIARGSQERREPVEAGEDAVLDRAGLTWPGQRMMAGTRKPPSKDVPLVALKGVMPPSGQVKTSAPLSVVKMTIVFSVSPMSSMCCKISPMLLSICAMPASSKP